jgi:hypothetical protein
MELTKYKPCLSPSEYTGFGYCYDHRSGKWYSDVAVFADDFSTDTSGDWNINNGTKEVMGEQLVYTTPDGNSLQVQLYKSFNVEIGKKYKVLYDLTYMGRQIVVEIGTVVSSGSYDYLTASSSISREVVITAETDEIFVTFQLATITGEYSAGVDNISIIPLNDDGTIDFSNATEVVGGLGIVGKTYIDADGGAERVEQLPRESYAEVLKSKELILEKTTWLNEDGIEYFDEGLLGVPDTTFSSTGARIYPDGTIRGKSSYGEYVKYPDGRLIYSDTGSTTSSSTDVGALKRAGYNGNYAHTFISPPVDLSDGWVDGIYSFATSAYTPSTTSFKVSLWGVNTGFTSANCTYRVLSIGRWK